MAPIAITPASTQRRQASTIAASASKTVASWFSSPGTLALLTTGKQAFLRKRKYVDKRTSDIIDLVLCLLSIVGALSIIIPYCFNRRSRKLRHSLILGLATSDLVSSIMITATTSVLLAGGDLNKATKFCTADGYILSTSIWTQHLWNLSIAVITYIILVFPLSPIVGQVERHLIWLWPIFWALAMIANGVGWYVVGFVHLDGFCTLNSRIHGDFAGIFQFVPRGIVTLVILVLYTHLFFYLRRIRLFSAAISSTRGSRRALSAGGDPSQSQQQQMRSRRSNASSNPNNAEHQTSSRGMTRTASYLISKVRGADSFGNRSRHPSVNRVQDDASADSLSKRNGSTSTQGQSSTSGATKLGGAGSSIEHIRLMDYNDSAQVSPTTVPANIDGTGDSVFQRQQAPVTIELPSQAQATTAFVASDNEAVPATTIDMNQEPLSPKTKPLLLDVQRLSRASVAGQVHRRGSHPSPLQVDSRSDDDAEFDEDGLSLDPIYTPMAVRRDVRDFGMTSAPREHLRHFSLTPAGLQIAKRAMVENAQSPTTIVGENEAAPPSPSALPAVKHADGNPEANAVTYEDLLCANWTWGMPVDSNTANGADSGTNSKRQSGSAAAAEPSGAGAHGRRHSRAWRLWGRPSRGDRSTAATVSTTSSLDENGVETTGSTLNRQASVLLLLYPAAYVLLFSVSIIRFLVDISTERSARDPKRNDDFLHSISRWTILAQGAIDAIVFQVIERAFRRRMKRRRRIAAGEKVDDTWAYKAFSWMRRSVVSLRRPSTASQNREAPQNGQQQ